MASIIDELSQDTEIEKQAWEDAPMPGEPGMNVLTLFAVAAMPLALPTWWGMYELFYFIKLWAKTGEWTWPNLWWGVGQLQVGGLRPDIPPFPWTHHVGIEKLVEKLMLQTSLYLVLFLIQIALIVGGAMVCVKIEGSIERRKAMTKHKWLKSKGWQCVKHTLRPHMIMEEWAHQYLPDRVFLTNQAVNKQRELEQMAEFEDGTR